MANNSTKHAYCIIAHNEPDLLRRLVAMIDDERNDIFLLIDKKADIRQFEGIKTRNAGLYYSERINVKWGDVSQIEAELTVLGCAFKHGPYKIYHLLSGVDLPIKSQDYIHSFIEEHPGEEFVSITLDEKNRQIAEYRACYYHFFLPYMRDPRKLIRKAACTFNRYSVKIQQWLGVKRKYPMEVLRGHNWGSITNELCGYLLSRKKEILSLYKHTFCSDESFLPSLVWASEFGNRTYKADRENDICLREIDWKRGKPYVWGSSADEKERSKDVSTLRESNCLFARKFSTKYDWIIDELEKSIL